MKNITEDEALRLVLAGTAGETGVGFFRALASSLSEVLGTMAAMVTEYRPADRKLRALAFLVRGEFVDGYEYAVDGTPCELALKRRGILQFRNGLPDFFPRDTGIVELGLVSYLGCPLLDEDGSTMGLLAVLDDKPMPAEERFISLFELFAARAAAEHRRLRLERELQARHLARGIDGGGAEALVEVDAAWHIRRANPVAEKLFACTTEDLIGESLAEFLRADSARYLREAAGKLIDGDLPGEWLPEAIVAQQWDRTEFEAEASVSRFENRGDVSYVVAFRRVKAPVDHHAMPQGHDASGEAGCSGGEVRSIIGRSEAIRRLKRSLAQVAATDATVLILGEPGTGKELVAKEIHAASRRREKPLVRVNCAAMPDNLIESEFFGHEKGAFTGATSRREGRFAMADGGTLFLDEVGELPLELQAKLLRVLQEGEFEPLGSDQTKRVDVRVIAATNRDLAAAVRNGNFREDLFYRLNVFPLHVPPLRERGDDVCRLAAAFIQRFSRTHGLPSAAISEEDVAALRRHPWPGNVRELQNTVERALIMARGGRFSITQAIQGAGLASEVRREESAEGEPTRILTAVELEEIERRNLLRALEHCGGKISGISGAAALLGIPPSTFSSRLKALGISRRR